MKPSLARETFIETFNETFTSETFTAAFMETFNATFTSEAFIESFTGSMKIFLDMTGVVSKGLFKGRPEAFSSSHSKVLPGRPDICAERFWIIEFPLGCH